VGWSFSRSVRTLMMLASNKNWSKNAWVWG